MVPSTAGVTRKSHQLYLFFCTSIVGIARQLRIVRFAFHTSRLRCHIAEITLPIANFDLQVTTHASLRISNCACQLSTRTSLNCACNMFDFSLHTPHPHSFFRTVMQFTPRNVKSHFHHWPHYASHVAHITCHFHVGTLSHHTSNILPLANDIAHFAFTCFFSDCRTKFHLPLDLSHIACCTLHRGLLLRTLHVFQIAQSHCTLQLICANHSLTQVRIAPHILKKLRTSRLTFRMSHVTLHLLVAHHTSHLSQEDLTSHSAHPCADVWQVMTFFRRRQQLQKTPGRGQGNIGLTHSTSIWCTP